MIRAGAIILAVLSAADSLGAGCPPSVAWTARFSSAGGVADYAYGLAIHPLGGTIYVVGVENRADLVEGDNWVIRRYAASGVLLGSTSYNSPYSQDDVCTYVAVDSAGNVVVAGSEERTAGEGGLNGLVRKYDPTLTTLIWSMTIQGAAGSFDEATGVAVIPGTSDDVAVVGYVTNDSGQGMDTITMRLDAATGNIVWARTVNGVANGDDAAESVACDSSGNIFMCGYRTVSGQDKDWLICKYASDRTWLWTQSYNDAANSEDVAHAVAVDPVDGHIVVAGYETRPDRLEGQNWMIRTYTNNLGSLRMRKYLEGMTEEAYAVTVDSSGYVYVAGAIDRWWTNQGMNWMVQKLDSSLSQEWVMTYGTAGSWHEWAHGIAVDASGNLYVSGWEFNNSANKYEDWVLFRLGQPGTCTNVPSAVATVDHSPVAETETLALTLKVTAQGVARTGILPFVATTLLTGDTNAVTYDTLSKPDPETVSSLAAGATHDFIWTYRMHGDGTGRYSNWAEYDIGGGVKVSTAIAEVDYAFTSLAAARKKAPPGKGIQVRNNILRVYSNRLAQVFVTGAEKNSTVKLAVYTSAGAAVGVLNPVTVDAKGEGYATFDGFVEGKYLRSGVYYIVATGGVVHRAPLMVINDGP